MIGLDRLSGPLPISSSDESSHAESLIHWVTEIMPPSMVVTSAPNQHPGFPSPGFFPSLSGAFILDLAKAIKKMEQDSTPKASHQPSPKEGVPPPVSRIPSAQGSSFSSAAEDSLSSIGGINIVLEKFFNQLPVSASWVDQVDREEATCFPSTASISEKDNAMRFPCVSVLGEADRFPSVSVSDFHGSLYDADVSQVTRPDWYRLSQGDAHENLPEGFSHWDGK
jgi:hypothetical protein